MQSYWSFYSTKSRYEEGCKSSRQIRNNYLQEMSADTPHSKL